MAKAKSKAPYDRVIQRYKRNILGTWNKNAAELVDRIDHAREGGSLERITGCPLLADSRLSIQESARFGEVYLAIYGEKSKAPHMPGTMAAWERNPKYVQLSRDAIYQFEYSFRPPEPALLSNLDAYFPGCLLIDVSEIEWKCGDSGEVEAVFVYPSYDEFEELPVLRYVAVSRDVRIAWYSRLFLKGDTVDDARMHTEDADKRHRASMIATEEDRLAYEALQDILEMIEFEKEDLNNLMDRLLDLMLNGTLVPEEAEPDGYARRLKLVSRFEAEEKAKYKALAEALQARESGYAESDAMRRDSFSQKQAETLTQATGYDHSETPINQDEDLSSSLREEVSLLREALVLAGERYEQLQSRADSDKATFLHHMHEVESRCRSLEKRSAALEKRATLIDELEIPKTPCEALALAKEAYPDKLLFLDQAMKSAEAFDGRPAGEVWALLRLMATVLHPLVFGEAKCDIAKAYQAESGFELALRESKKLKSKPKCIDERTVRYEDRPDGMLMIAHVKGRSSKFGEALRVHFAPDHDRQLLVIGHCGDHLPS